MTNWTDEDKEVVKALLLEGLTSEQVSAETEIPKGTINGWKSKWQIRHKNSYKELYKGTVAEVQAKLIELMKSAPEVGYAYFNSADSNVPPATTYRKYFGSWSNALAAAGITSNSSTSKKSFSQKETKETVVYLVKFDEFYKIGTTQQTISQRLGGRYPSYTIVTTKSFPTLLQAKEVEKSILSLVKDCKYIPTNFPAEGRGFTECFKPDVETLDQVLSQLV
jgi:hypothetical protein